MRTTSQKTKKQNQSLHSECSKIIEDYLKEHGFDVKSSEDPSHNYIVNGKKCRVNAHKIIPTEGTRYKAGPAVVIELATDQHTMIDVGYDCILYMDPSDKSKFYMADVKSVYNAIQTKMGKKDSMGNINRHYFPYTRKDVLENTGYCVGITEKAFANINGVTMFNI